MHFIPNLTRVTVKYQLLFNLLQIKQLSIKLNRDSHEYITRNKNNKAVIRLNVQFFCKEPNYVGVWFFNVQFDTVHHNHQIPYTLQL